MSIVEIRAKRRAGQGIFTDADLARAKKAQKSGNTLMMELALFAIPGGALIKGGMFAFKVGNKLLKGKQAVEAARKAVAAAKAKSPAKAAQAASVVKNLRAGTRASATRQRRTRVKLKREKDVAVSKQKPTARKEGGKDTTAAAPKQKAPDPIVEKKPPPRAPGLAKNRTRVDAKTPKKLTGGTKQLRERLLNEQERRQKGQLVASVGGKTRLTPKGKKALAASTTGLAGLGLTAAQLRALRSSGDSASTAAAATTKTQKSPGGKPGPLRGKLPGGKPGPRKSGKTAAQAAAEEAAARKRIRDAAKKKKDAETRKGPEQASDAAKRRPKRPKADQSRPRGGKVTAKRINPSMRDRGRAFQGSYDPKTEVLRNITVDGKRKTMVFKKKK